MKLKLFNFYLHTLFILVFAVDSFWVNGQNASVFWPLTGDFEAVVTGNLIGIPLDYSPRITENLSDRLYMTNMDRPELDPSFNFEVSVAPEPGFSFRVENITIDVRGLHATIMVDVLYSFSPNFENYEIYNSYQIKKSDLPPKIKIRNFNVTLSEGEILYIRACPYKGVVSNELATLHEVKVEGTTSVYVPPSTITYNKQTLCHGEGIAIAEFIGPEGGSFSSVSGLVVDPLSGNIDIDSSLPGNYTVSYVISGEVVASTNIAISQLPECLISGPDQLLCPNSTYTFTAPDDMYEYFWEVTGNATIQGDSGNPSVEVKTGESCEDSFTLTLTVTNDNNCSDGCSREYVIGETIPVTLDVPENFTASTCQSQEDINDLFDTWLSQATFEGGCNARLTTIPEVEELVPPDACGGSITVTWSATSDCGPAVEETAMFTVPGASPLTLTVPDDMNIETSCLPQEDINQAFEDWLAKAKAEGGCNTLLTVVPSAEELKAPDACGGQITVEWTAASDCDDVLVKSATFNVAEAIIPVSAVMSGTQVMCAGQSAEIIVSLSGQAPWTFTWSDGYEEHVVIDTFEPLYTIEVNPTVSTTYRMTGLVTDGSGASGEATGEATVYVGPVTTVPHINACRNTSIKVPVSVSAFSDVRDISLTLKYDGGVLSYTGFENGALPFEEGEIIVNDVPSDGNSHLLRISKVSDTDELPVLDDDAVLIWLYFEYTSGYTALEWIDAPDDSWCSYSFMDKSDDTGFETEVFCDLPTEAYYKNGSVSSYPVPDVNIIFNGIIAGYDDSFTFCNNEIVSITLQALEGTAPYEVRWTVNSGEEESALLEDGDHLFDGTLSAGTHVLQLTSLTDANGCELADVSAYRTTLIINEQPDVFFTLNGKDLKPFDVVNICADVSSMPLTLVDHQGGEDAKGLAPFSFSFKISNGGFSGSFEDVDYGTITDVIGYLPKDQYGQPVAGEYVAEITSFSDANGCHLSSEALAYYKFTLIVDPHPDFLLALNEIPFMPGSTEALCFDEQVVNLTLLETLGDKIAAGKAPFDLTMTINGGEDIAITDIHFNTNIDLLPFLPADPESGELLEGDYVINFTQFSDADGCFLIESILNNHIYTVRINPEPKVNVVTKDAVCLGTASGSVIMEPANVNAVYIYTLEPGGLHSLDQTGTYEFKGLAAGSYTWTMTDVFTSCVSNGIVTVGEPDAIALTGSIRYYNTSETPLEGVTIGLLEPGSGFIVATAVTNNDGTYTFDQVCPGVYDVEINTDRPIYSINSTDAGQVNAWNIAQSGSSWPAIEKVRFLAGDVNGDDHANSGDAAMIQNYFLTLGMEVEFDNEWEFWKINDPVTLQPQTNNLLQLEIPAGSNGEEQDFFGLASGDFNRSFVPFDAGKGNPLVKSAQTTEVLVSLLKGKEISVDAGDVVELPIRAGSQMQLGAISLILEFPVSNLEVLDVFLKEDHDQSAAFNIVNNMLVIGWNSVDPLTVEEGETMLTVRLKTLTGSENEPIYFELAANPLNELADGDLTAIYDASLVMDGLFIKEIATETDLQESPQYLTMKCYPNPFENNFAISYTLPENGKVTIDITGIMGNRLFVVQEEFKTQGEYTVVPDHVSLAPGVYQIILRFTGQAGNTSFKTARIIRK